MIPAICLVALVTDAVLVCVFRGTFVSGYAKYLLLDVLLGIENEPGLRFQTVDIPLGKTEGAALNGELPQWERVGVLASHPWNGSDPEPWTVSAVLEALAQANDVVVVDIGAPSALHSLPMLRQCRQVVLAELTVLGLARARAARAMMIR